jgi:hypothetical protein
MAKPRDKAMMDRFQQISLTDEWFGLFTPDSGVPEPYEWFMERVIGFVCMGPQPGRLALRGFGCNGHEFPEFTHYAFGKDKAKGDQRWIDIYNSAEEGFWAGNKHVTKLVRKIKGFEKDFRW